MCGITGLVGPGTDSARAEAMVAAQGHRGPDATGLYADPAGPAALGLNRLAIMDPTPAAHGPMASPDGRYWLAFNGEVYNHRELRAELRGHPFRSRGDTEVVLAAFARWGPACLERFVGMFALLIWDARERRLFAARDRFGVKPLLYATLPAGGLALASEARALHAAGVPAHHDEVAWATYLTSGLQDHGERTFWDGITALRAGHQLTWQDGRTEVSPWYDLAARVGDAVDERPVHEVRDECAALLDEAVALRLRADVPVGVNLSGGLDSSLLLRLARRHRPARELAAFTFVTGDARYDELPWVRETTRALDQELVVCRLEPHEVPALAASVQSHQDGPFGGLPTLAYATLFATARSRGHSVLLDGQGMDEAWAGYDYYRHADAGSPIVQAAGSRLTRPECLRPEFRERAERLDATPAFADPLRALQHRDAMQTKLPRCLRFNDRVSMRSSVELREPFLDHRLFELALRQPADRRIRDGVGKWLLRDLPDLHLPAAVRHAPKRPLQTPQREWLRGPLRGWADERIEAGLATLGRDWLDPDAVRRQWAAYRADGADNAFFVWQWVNLGLVAEAAGRPSEAGVGAGGALAPAA